MAGSYAAHSELLQTEKGMRKGTRGAHHVTHFLGQ